MEFKYKINEVLKNSLNSIEIERLQVNLGYRCNMSCRHCHVSASPGRPETMGRETIEDILAVLLKNNIKKLDITGGAPELNLHFDYFVAEAVKIGCHVIVRSNLTVLFEKGLEYLSEFYREHNVEITASLPCYTDINVDSIRGKGAFRKSIDAIRNLNRLGYGTGNENRKLNLVYNPSGAFLAPDQRSLEQDYHRELAVRYGVIFDHLFAFSNMPVGRYKDHLEKTGSLKKYLEMLEESFNPLTLDALMCRHLISVGWNGMLYDCDFNQALGLNIHNSCPQHIRDFDHERLAKRVMQTGNHCYGCTAGQGST